MVKIPENQEMYLQEICQKISDKKGFNILTLDVRGVCGITDYFIIAEGNVERHVQGLAKNIQEIMSNHKMKPYHIEGEQTGDWIVLDYADIMVHLFIPDMREKYMLEQVWKGGKIVDIQTAVASGNS